MVPERHGLVKDIPLPVGSPFVGTLLGDQGRRIFMHMDSAPLHLVDPIAHRFLAFLNRFDIETGSAYLLDPLWFRLVRVNRFALVGNLNFE